MVLGSVGRGYCKKNRVLEQGLGAVLKNNSTLTIFRTLNGNNLHMQYLNFGKK